MELSSGMEELPQWVSVKTSTLVMHAVALVVPMSNLALLALKEAAVEGKKLTGVQLVLMVQLLQGMPIK